MLPYWGEVSCCVIARKLVKVSNLPYAPLLGWRVSCHVITRKLVKVSNLLHMYAPLLG